LKKHTGGFMTSLISIIAILLICGSSVLFIATLRDRNIKKGEAFLRSGDYAAAMEVFKQADKFSLRSEARVVKGLAAASLGLEDYESALKYYQKLTGLEPDNIEAHFAIGQLYIRAKDYGGAEREVSKLRSIGSKEAVSAAEKLTSHMHSGMVKGFFRDIFNKIAPSFPKVPGLTEDEPIKPDLDSDSESGSDSASD